MTINSQLSDKEHKEHKELRFLRKIVRQRGEDIEYLNDMNIPPYGCPYIHANDYEKHEEEKQEKQKEESEDFDNTIKIRNKEDIERLKNNSHQ